MMVCRALAVFLMSKPSSLLSWDSGVWVGGVRSCFGVQIGVSGGVGDFGGGGEGLQKEMGWLGLGACQFGESAGFRFLAKGCL
jgi:hypothetical protein